MSGVGTNIDFGNRTFYPNVQTIFVKVTLKVNKDGVLQIYNIQSSYYLCYKSHGSMYYI